MYDQGMKQRQLMEYSVTEELVHAITHGIGVILSIVGLSWMLYVSINIADPWRIVSSSIYGATLITLFLASTLYHSMYASRHRELFKLLGSHGAGRVVVPAVDGDRFRLTFLGDPLIREVSVVAHASLSR